MYLNRNVPILVGLIILFITLILKYKDWGFKKSAVVSLLVIYLSYVIAYTHFPIPFTSGAIETYREIYYSITKVNPIPNFKYNDEMLLNIVMTIPLGVFIFLVDKKHDLLRAIVLGFLFSLSIELSQWVLSSLLQINAWVFDANDLINNTVGTAIGYLVISLLFKIKSSLTK